MNPLGDCATPVVAHSDGFSLQRTPKRNTILDKIAELAKIIAGLNFCVRATLRLWGFVCPTDTIVADERTKLHCLSLSGHQIIERAHREFSANS